MTSDRGAVTLVAPISGVVVPLDAVPDPAFAQRLAGDGVSIDPLSDLVVAPCDAVVRLVHRAGHAVTIEASGLEIVIHVGLDTVALRGEGFHPLVKSGDSVRAGDPLLRFDVDFVARRARSLLTEMVIANMDVVSALRPRSGRVVGGRDVVLEVSLHEQHPAAEPTSNLVGEPASADMVRSAPIVVAAETGLHARPAAVVAATARRFAADVRLVNDRREANARMRPPRSFASFAFAFAFILLHCAAGAAPSGIRMSSFVPSFLSGPALVTMTSSSPHTILYGVSHGSVIFDAALSSFLSRRSSTDGQGSPG